MDRNTLFRLGDDALERSMLTLFAEDAPRFALQIAHLAEFDDRRLYAREGYPSLFAYCVEQIGLSDDAAMKRIRAARAARRHSVLFDALADGRLHLTAIVLLAPRLTDDNVCDLIAAAAHRTVPAIQQMLAMRFPSPDVPLSLEVERSKVVSKPPGSHRSLPADSRFVSRWDRKAARPCSVTSSSSAAGRTPKTWTRH